MSWTFYKEGQHLTVETQSVITVNSVSAILTLVLQDMGIGLTNSFLKKQLDKNNKLIPILTQWMPPQDRGIYLCYAERKLLPKKTRVVIDFLLSKLSTS